MVSINSFTCLLVNLSTRQLSNQLVNSSTCQLVYLSTRLLKNNLSTRLLVN